MGQKTVDKDVLAKLFPGKQVEVAEGIIVTVYPVGICHLRRFNKAVEEVIPKISSQVNLNLIKDKEFKDLLPMIVPIVLSDLLDIVNDCVNGLDILSEGVPHWILPKIVDAWLDESFGSEDKLRPWIEVVDNTVERLTGKKAGIWETLSKSLSGTDTTSEES